MKFIKKDALLASIVLGLALTLSGCSGGNNEVESNSIALSSPPSAAPADTTTVDASRNVYAIKRSSLGFSLVNKGIAGGVTNLSSSQTVIKFNDFTVNLLAGDKSKTIARHDLNMLIELYIAFFNRVPDAEGMIYWIETIKAGRTIEQLADNFYTAAIEAPADTGYSANMNTEEFIRKIYKNVLGRDEVDQGGLEYWSSEINSGGKSRGNLIRDIINAAHSFKNDTEYGWVADLLDNKVIVGTYFSIQQGLNYNTRSESITRGMKIAGMVKPNDISAAINEIGITDSALDLRNPQPIPQVTISTSMGDILVELNPEKAPITVTNFLRYTDVGFYSNKIFHRVISNFMIQGGGFTTSLVQSSTYAPIQLEVNKGLSNVRGSIAMARTNVFDSATAQFFINVEDNILLDTNGGGYAVFGRVIAGMDIVDKIKVVPTTTYGGLENLPTTPVLIVSVTRAN
ncbi:peptidylprolyl isomerase [Undibacterium amnicola]|uniref:peptidylprolyl isomerase n=1 Tax=Undibacterium amnicola TaxID=1834038 RepID=A0ABR6XNW5_9BURK|nr:peptidylprolyl isomerase [Undibacterium amnicola]MBC3831083.1 peptidylprolyl isomerase [Undibacterium amnicola]